MKLNKTISTKTIKGKGLVFSFLESGDIFDITYENNQINLIKGNGVDGTLMNIYLRITSEKGMFYTKLIGTNSPSTFERIGDDAFYYGTFHKVKYQIKLSIQHTEWHFDILLKSDDTVDVDIFYGQDVAIAHKASVLSSEPYTVQYIDYKSNLSKNGYVLSARQNQGMSQYLQIGSHTKNISYATDGFQFFGLTYKETGVPEALNQKHLPSEIYQYEFSYLSLQSEIITLGTDSKHVHFYGLYKPTHVDIDTPLFEIEPLGSHHDWLDRLDKPSIKYPLDSSKMCTGADLSNSEIEDLFENMRHIEYKDQHILSFFTHRHHHVVLKQKERLVERPHGHLMIHGDLLHASENVMATTNFMFGLFSSHLVLGNTSFNKFLGDMRNPLNLHKISGTRLYIKIDGQYHLLGIPSYYEMGGTTTRWYYKIDNDVLIIDAFVHMNEHHQALTFHSQLNKTYDIIISSQILMGENEYTSDVSYERIQNALTFGAPQDSMIHHHYPNLKYKMVSSLPFDILTQAETFGTKDQHGLLLMQYSSINHLRIDTLATFESDFIDTPLIDYETCDDLGTQYFESFAAHLDLRHNTYQNELDQLIDISFWYTHNALTHYASPHGLEQYNGAAWGTRDVCQGPIEFFSAVHRFDIVREILLKVYKQQFIENGDFPQWYMFDKYYKIQAHESHGDIIIWPLRSLAYYLKATGDFTILEENVPFMSINDHAFTKAYSIMTHLDEQIKAIKQSFIPNTHLPRYGGGDWDDTLQPANHDLTNKMVSGWTVALLFESIFELSEQLKNYDKNLAKSYRILSDHIKKDYETYMVIDQVPAGFVVFDDEITYLLHPRDEKTGLKYRLLPFTRSMIANLVDKKHVNHYVDIINRYFKHPDGVRLMDTAVAYHGGEKTYFVRAETAANFGREIGLQYVHAHIRYIEAMANIGHNDAAYEGLFTINPILIQDTVKNAYFRQSNVYFSSSDAWFKNRYEANEAFEKVRRGDILVKGGWRLYSSGPGIYMHQLITRIFGIRIQDGHLIIDPALPKKLDGLSMSYHFMNKNINITFHQGDQPVLINGAKVHHEKLKQTYKDSGIIIDKKELLKHKGLIEIDVWTTST